MYIVEKTTILPLKGGKKTQQPIICDNQSNSKKDNERSSSYKEHKVNALVPRADEGRDKLR